MILKRLITGAVVLSMATVVYYGCDSSPSPEVSETESFRDVIEMRECSDGVRYWVVCMDGSTEYRTEQDLQEDNVCLAKPLLQVTATGGTVLGRISTGPNCLLNTGTSARLMQPPTMLNEFQAVVQPQIGAIPGCSITSGIVLRSDVEFIYDTPSYPSIPSYPDNPSYPCG